MKATVRCILFQEKSVSLQCNFLIDYQHELYRGQFPSCCMGHREPTDGGGPAPLLINL